MLQIKKCRLCFNHKKIRKHPNLDEQLCQLYQYEHVQTENNLFQLEARGEEYIQQESRRQCCKVNSNKSTDY